MLARHRRKSLRFVLAACLNTAVGLAAFPLLLWLSPYFRIHYVAALMLVQALCLCFAFTTYKLGVFRARGNIVAEFAKFSSFYVVNYAANWVLLPLLVEVVRLDPVVAQLGITAVVMVGSFFWHNKITFSERRAEPGSGA